MEKTNTNFKLSDSQVAQLFEFTEKKLVHWYDLQIEMVDHLASGIENEMLSSPDLTFDSALAKIYKSFGLFGFAKIVQERQAQLAKAAKKMWWSELRTIFHWPEIILFTLIISAVSTVSLLVSSDILYDLFLVIYVTISLLFFVYVIRDFRIQKKLLLMQYGATYFSSPFIYEFIILAMVTHISPQSFTILLTVGILIKLTSLRLYNKIRSEAKFLYPSVFLK